MYTQTCFYMLHYVMYLLHVYKYTIFIIIIIIIWTLESWLAIKDL